MGRFAILFLFLLVLLVSASLVNAATIHGTIYDLSLRKLSNVGVEINTSPKQFLVAQNGSYSFDVQNGFYTIKAQLMQKNAILASVQENMTIKQDGSYVLDLILFPDVEEGVGDIDIEVNGDIVEAGNNRIAVGTIVFLALGTILIAFSYFKKQKNEMHEEKTKTDQKEEKYEGNDLEQLIKIIRQEGGRATQKDIRRQIPLSEAKISLMIAELEHKGIIEKIKKGRGNIIILKKK